MSNDIKDSATGEYRPRTGFTAERSPSAHFLWKKHTLLGAASDRHLNAAAFRALILVIDRMFDDRIESWPSQSLISEAAGMSRRAIQEGLERLVRRGHLELRNRTGRSNVYRLSKKHHPDVGNESNGKKTPAQEAAPVQNPAHPPTNENYARPTQDTAHEASQGNRKNKKLSIASSLADKRW